MAAAMLARSARELCQGLRRAPAHGALAMPAGAVRGFATADEGGEVKRRGRGKPSASERKRHRDSLKGELDSRFPTLRGVNHIYNAGEVVEKIYPKQSIKEMGIIPELDMGPFASLEEGKEYSSKRAILRWTTGFMMEPGGWSHHNYNKKASVKVLLEDLKQESGLSDEGAQYVAALCGPRYNAGRGEITLVCESYATSEDNRRRLVEILRELVEEGKNPPEGLAGYLALQKEKKAPRARPRVLGAGVAVAET